MSTNICEDEVTRVCIAGEWYGVEDRSFRIDDYEFSDDRDHTSYSDESHRPNGFAFKHRVDQLLLDAGNRLREHWISGPVASIQAVWTETMEIPQQERPNE